MVLIKKNLHQIILDISPGTRRHIIIPALHKNIFNCSLQNRAKSKWATIAIDINDS